MRPALISAQEVVEFVGQAQLFEVLEHAAEVHAALLGKEMHRPRALGQYVARRLRPDAVHRKGVLHHPAAQRLLYLVQMLAQEAREFACEALLAVAVAERVDAYFCERRAPLGGYHRHSLKEHDFPDALMRADDLEPELPGVPRGNIARRVRRHRRGIERQHRVLRP